MSSEEAGLSEGAEATNEPEREGGGEAGEAEREGEAPAEDAEEAEETLPSAAESDGGAEPVPAPPLTAEEVESTARRSGVFVIGLTGPFGSGCTTAAGMLATGELPFVSVKLSGLLRQLTRGDDRDKLQDLGNRLRQEEGNAALAIRALGQALTDEPDAERIVLDGIRNLGEVRWLRRVLGDRFSLFAIIADTKVRFERQGGRMSWNEFYALDQRDQGESEDYGQQVNRCVDFADVLIPNSEDLPSWDKEPIFGAKVREYAALVEGRLQRYATPSEMLMNVAYAASHGSKCLKRQVGCVIAQGTEPLSSGYNENPEGLKPCIEQFGTCYRDIVRHERFQELALSGAGCPFCASPIPSPLSQPWSCPGCGRSLDAAFFPDRAMKWCTALHAEERALINAGDRDLSSATLYTTTFPCMLCAEKIIHAGIRDVVFIEAYPDAHGVILFGQASVTTHRFEGVRSRNFERYFGGTQRQMEEAGKLRLRQIAGLS
jgi:deoxycytidylate deaminase/dephospho-CoA kinase